MRKSLAREGGPSKKILVLEPFADPSHQSFYRGWSQNSHHTFEVIELSNHHWKWRSRHASLTLAEKIQKLDSSEFDLVFCSEMLNLAEWRGFAGLKWAALPAIAYFHENQFTYPTSPLSTHADTQRDMHFAYSNALTAIAADQVWFNSHYHLQDFRDAAVNWFSRMPDFRQTTQLQLACDQAKVRYPGIERINPPSNKRLKSAEDPLCIGWVARWEHDKRPDRFLALVRRLQEKQIPFELILLGADFQSINPSYRELINIANEQIRHAGFVESKQNYQELLAQIDVVISTADHEFFGIAIVEAIAAGAVPMLPNRLAYPEVLSATAGNEAARFLYTSEEELFSMICSMSKDNSSWKDVPQDCSSFSWTYLTEQFDRSVNELCKESSSAGSSLASQATTIDTVTDEQD